MAKRPQKQPAKPDSESREDISRQHERDWLEMHDHAAGFVPLPEDNEKPKKVIR